VAKRRKRRRRAHGALSVSKSAPTVAPVPEAAARLDAAWLPRATWPRELDDGLPARRLLAGVFALGLTLRVAHLVALKQSPLFTSLQLDARYYDAWAREIAGGAWIGKAAFWVDPLHAYVLGIVYKLLGHELLWPRLLNLALGLGTAWLVSRIARRVWGSRLAEISAALLSISFIPAIHFEGQPEKTALSVFLLAASIHLFFRERPRMLLASGVTLGLSVLARGNALLLLPIAVLVVALGWDRKRGPSAPSAERARRASLLLAGALPVIGLATIHNYLASRELVLTTTNVGINLYLGNHPGNSHGYYSPPSFLHPSTDSEARDFRAEAERRTGVLLGDAALSTYWAAEARKAVTDEPGRAVTRTLSKLALALHNDEVPDSDAPEIVAEWSPLLKSPLFWFGQLMPLAVLGAVAGWRRRRVRIVAGVALLYLASLLPFFVMARLRVQLLPMLVVLAAGGVVWAIAVIRERKPAALARGAGLALALGFACFYRPAFMAERRETSLAVGYNNLGATLLEMGKIDDAVRAYERAVALRDDAVPASLRSLGQIYLDRGEKLRAETLLRRLLELRPDNRFARENLERLSGAGSPGASSALERARALNRQGLHDEAIALLRQTVQTGPYDEGLRYYLGESMERYATPQAMVEFFSAEAARDPKPQTSHYFWAVGLARGGDVGGAIARLQHALSIDPAHELSQRKWGLLLEAQGDLDGAFEHLLEATRIHPDFRAAFEDAARVAERLGRGAEAERLRERSRAADPNSVRRFLHWARYLHARGRNLEAWKELERMLAERPDDGEALALKAAIRSELEAAGLPIPAEREALPPRSWRLSEGSRAAFEHKLLTLAEPSSTWLVYDGRDAGARELARDLARVFELARWRIEGLTAAKLPLKPGIHVFAAAEPTRQCRAVADALQAAGFEPTFGSGYRAFIEERKQANPSFLGLDFELAQDHVLAVGRKPE
jgi:tetratricopeptide (TPR) repeat protein/4-amino-4-deoxy-L-arabinose transferase-like glycosyltransferase